IFTSGEIFPRGELIERLTENRLLFGDPKQDEPVIAESIEWDGKTYAASPMDPGLANQLRFPSGVAACPSFEGILDELARLTELDANSGFLLGTFKAATWFTPWLVEPPRLNIVGPPGSENLMVSILSCVC